MFKIIIEETGNGTGKQSVVESPNGKFYVVSSVVGYADETYIFPSNDKGEIEKWSEVWGTRPSNHQEILNKLTNGELTEKDFY